jgi:hypothetical protein
VYFGGKIRINNLMGWPHSGSYAPHWIHKALRKCLNLSYLVPLEAVASVPIIQKERLLGKVDACERRKSRMMQFEKRENVKF